MSDRPIHRDLATRTVVQRILVVDDDDSNRVTLERLLGREGYQVEHAASGREAIVYDYKGKTATEQAKWLEKGKLQIGLYMLALRHVLGLEPVGGLHHHA